MFEVQEVQAFTDTITTLKKEYPRIHEAVDIAKKVLQSSADRLPGVIGKDWRYIRTRQFPGIPSVAIIFRIDGNGLVYLLRAELCGDEE